MPVEPFVLNLPADVPMRDTCDEYEEFTLQSEQVLNAGTYGRVHATCRRNDCTYAAKVVRFDRSRYDLKYIHRAFLAECLISQYAGTQDLGIPLQTFFLCDQGQTGVIIMDQYQGTILEIQDQLQWSDWKALLDKVNRLHEAGILHRDLFLKNTMYRRTQQGYDLRLIDFGMSIAFEHRHIPAALRAIDFLNLLSGIKDSTLRDRGRAYVATLVGRTAVREGSTLLASHATECGSEHKLLGVLPTKWIRLMGPATVDTMVWSVRCSPTQDQQIVAKTRSRVESVLSSQS